MWVQSSDYYGHRKMFEYTDTIGVDENDFFFRWVVKNSNSSVRVAYVLISRFHLILTNQNCVKRRKVANSISWLPKNYHFFLLLLFAIRQIKWSCEKRGKKKEKFAVFFSHMRKLFMKSLKINRWAKISRMAFVYVTSCELYGQSDRIE